MCVSKVTDELKASGKDILVGLPIVFVVVGLLVLLFATFKWKAFLIIVLVYIAGAACLGVGNYLRNELGIWKK